tara:strand:- start:126 stop:347 length:222 start_codon:yes stop_codon:yes gene_type:complete
MDNKKLLKKSNSTGGIGVRLWNKFKNKWSFLFFNRKINIPLPYNIHNNYYYYYNDDFLDDYQYKRKYARYYLL